MEGSFHGLDRWWGDWNAKYDNNFGNAYDQGWIHKAWANAVSPYKWGTRLNIADQEYGRPYISRFDFTWQNTPTPWSRSQPVDNIIQLKLGQGRLSKLGNRPWRDIYHTGYSVTTLRVWWYKRMGRTEVRVETEIIGRWMQREPIDPQFFSEQQLQADGMLELGTHWQEPVKSIRFIGTYGAQLGIREVQIFGTSTFEFFKMSVFRAHLNTCSCSFAEPLFRTSNILF
jgi:hypothetical protein